MLLRALQFLPELRVLALIGLEHLLTVSGQLLVRASQGCDLAFHFRDSRIAPLKLVEPSALFAYLGLVHREVLVPQFLLIEQLVGRDVRRDDLRLALGLNLTISEQDVGHADGHQHTGAHREEPALLLLDLDVLGIGFVLGDRRAFGLDDLIGDGLLGILLFLAAKHDVVPPPPVSGVECHRV